MFFQKKKNESSKSLIKNKVLLLAHSNSIAVIEVTHFLEMQKIEPIRIHDQDSTGNTYKEKLEKVSDVGYAIIILSPYDVSKPIVDRELHSRPCPNSIYEYGFLSSKLGSENVCILCEKGLELPSVFRDLYYISLFGSWKLELANSMKRRGFNIDINNIY